MSLDQLRPVAEASFEPGLMKRLGIALQRTKDSCEVLRVHRNKRLAHADLNVAMETEAVPGFSRETIEGALDAARDLMNELNLHYKGGPTVYEHTIVQGEAESLLACLRDGLKLRELRRRLHDMTDEEVRRVIMDRRNT